MADVRDAVRDALGDYLRTQLTASFSGLLVASDWPQGPELPPYAIAVTSGPDLDITEHPPQAMTVTPTTGVNATVLISRGRVRLGLQVDAWAQFQGHRDALAAAITAALNRPPQTTLSLGGVPEYDAAPGLVLQLPTWFNTIADYSFVVQPNVPESPPTVARGEWRAIWQGSALVHLLSEQAVALIKSMTATFTVNGAPAVSVDLDP